MHSYSTLVGRSSGNSATTYVKTKWEIYKSAYFSKCHSKHKQDLFITMTTWSCWDGGDLQIFWTHSGNIPVTSANCANKDNFCCLQCHRASGNCSCAFFDSIIIITTTTMFCSTVTSSAQLSAAKTKKGKRNAEERYVAVKNHVPSPRSVQVQTVARPWPHKRPAQEPWASKQVSNCLTERFFLCCITGALFSGQNNCPSKVLCTPLLQSSSSKPFAVLSLYIPDPAFW